MQKLTEKQIALFKTKKGIKGNAKQREPIVQKLQQMAVGDIYLVFKKEWPYPKMGTSYIVAMSKTNRILFPNFRISVATLQDESGWIIKRVA